MKQTLEKVNVAPSSDEGHFVEKSKNVVEIEKVNETFKVEGPALLTTKNHTNLEIKEDCLIVCQQVYDPFKQMHERSKD